MRTKALSALCLLALIAALPAAAQFEAPLLSKVYPNLVNPGGKSLAMGGAFVAQADDATAAYANPAGLAGFGAWELGLSGKNFKFEPRLTTQNYLENPPGTITPTSTDVYEPSDSATELEFASLVIPVFENFSLAAYRAVNLRYKLDASEVPGGNYRAFYVNRGLTSSISFDEQGGVDLRNELYGISAGYRVGRVSFGAGATFNKLRYDLTGGAAGGPHMIIANADNGNRRDVPDPRIDAVVGTSVESGTKVGWVAGLKIDIAEAPRLSFGASYRKAPEFDVSYSVQASYPGFPELPTISFACGREDPNAPGSGTSSCGTFKVPDDWSLGLSIAPVGNLTIVAEVQRVMYSQFNDGYVPLFSYTGCPASAGAACTADQRVRTVSKGESDDGTVPRVGAEYTFEFSSGTQLSLRAGWYREPAHGTKVALYPDQDRNRQPDSGSPAKLVNPPFSDAFATSFNGGEAENHGSFGIGMLIGRHLSLDLAADFGKTSRQIVLSAFFRL